MKKYVSIIILLMLNVFMFSVCNYFRTLRLEEPKISVCLDEETAIKIVQYLYEDQCGVLLDKRLFNVSYHPEYNEYEVELRSYTLENTDTGRLDGGGIFINKDNGQIWWSVVIKGDIEDSYYGRMEELK